MFVWNCVCGEPLTLYLVGASLAVPLRTPLYCSENVNSMQFEKKTYNTLSKAMLLVSIIKAQSSICISKRTNSVLAQRCCSWSFKCCSWRTFMVCQRLPLCTLKTNYHGMNHCQPQKCGRLTTRPRSGDTAPVFAALRLCRAVFVPV